MQLGVGGRRGRDDLGGEAGIRVGGGLVLGGLERPVEAAEGQDGGARREHPAGRRRAESDEVGGLGAAHARSAAARKVLVHHGPALRPVRRRAAGGGGGTSRLGGRCGRAGAASRRTRRGGIGDVDGNAPTCRLAGRELALPARGASRVFHAGGSAVGCDNGRAEGRASASEGRRGGGARAREGAGAGASEAEMVSSCSVSKHEANITPSPRDRTACTGAGRSDRERCARKQPHTPQAQRWGVRCGRECLGRRR